MSTLAPLSPNRPVTSRSFTFVSSSSSDDDDDAPLPFPTALPRSDFLAPDFDPAEYLSSLANRHQTLEDLRSDLRERSAAISTELLELVNSNYTSFLSLGDELKGGEDRVEDVRVALLGFRRAIEEIKGRVQERGTEVADLNKDLVGVRGEVETGRKMLELDERISALEGRLAIGSIGPDSDDSDEDDDENEDELDGAVGSSSAKLSQLANEYVTIDELADDIGRDTPFVRKTEERLIRCRNTVLLDLGAALKEAKQAGGKGQAKLLKLMGIYALLDAQAEAVKALKSK
ncbi:oligomeric golgi complex component, COG2-domain-containing protein [Annulohypoxylon maeteangense]|uniref:oligomeric golgi complex component, COG2-domain-containing protein n=1 Tax=Annulohypoxylon maeteangense TaxID=1927788 RepID=UPI0020072772|nr:oligomeric golgi complex component, COG2-domain-containing protein [Annulohypoxylon maeteangense]KAI0883053.1 oligomeric golgi complex component, COG2-domain-containing protein [Annulohypoxylon maeteangense]